ncbi:MAG: hypothetical protein KDC80_28835, partial [Saprospiraceae bacterium]|nr:hypothetical protein [Saprospiraceae bacterium]
MISTPQVFYKVHLKIALNLFWLLALTLPYSDIFAQYTVSVDAPAYSADFNVRIDENILYADIDVEIGESLLYKDFTVGFTDSKSRADVIISNSNYNSDINIHMSTSLYADLVVDVSENQLYEDIGIEIRTSGYVDYLIYNEDNFLTKEKLVASLLPIINSYLDYKFEKIPFWSAENGLSEPGEELSPVIYC